MPSFCALFRQATQNLLDPFRVLGGQVRTCGIGLLLASITCLAGPPLIWAQPSARPYQAAKHGGNYMHNFYLPPAPSSTPWAPSWSPDGLAIAVGMSGSIWTVDPTTGIANELTHGKKYHSSPDWSPDGAWIIYTADDGGTTIQLEILNFTTGESQALTDDGFIYTDPTFSPDGTQIAYVSTKPNGYFNIYTRSILNGEWLGEEVGPCLTRSTSSVVSI